MVISCIFTMSMSIVVIVKRVFGFKFVLVGKYVRAMNISSISLYTQITQNVNQ